MSPTAEVDDVVRRSLTEFFEHIRVSRWRGREREAVSLYAFGFLQRQFGSGQALHDPAQVGVEVAVPGIDSVNRKNQVCKDLVLWASPGMTCWDGAGAATRSPLAILEWKVYRKGKKGAAASASDVEWLKRFSTGRPEFAGFAVSLLLGSPEVLNAERVHEGEIQTGWLRL